MGFTIPSLDEAHGFGRALGRALLPLRDWSPLGLLGKLARWFAGVSTDLHAHIDAVRDDLLPDTASETALDRWGRIRGVTRKGATPARKSDALRVHGANGTALTIGLELTSAAGLRFQVNENETIPSQEFVDVDVVGIDTGSQTRLPAGETLTFTSPPAGVEEEAQLVLDLDEDGVDAEEDGAYRTRVLEKFSTPPLGGAAADYEQWATEVTGIESAYAYPLRQGLGSVDLAALHTGSGSARLLVSGELAELDAYVQEKKPVGVTLRTLTVNATSADIDVRIRPNGEAQYEFDWDDSTPLVVGSWTAGTRTLAFTTARPDTMQAGDRLTIKPAAGGGDGVQHVIESLSSTNAVVLEAAPATAPVATDTVYSGGPLVDPIRDALIEHIDNLGPSNTDANPYGPWEANLRPENVSAISQSFAGAKKSTVILPASTLEPADNAYPLDDTVYILVPRLVLVRRDW
jgi:hypothetical protein